LPIAGLATVNLPVPAAGFIRIFDSTFVLADIAGGVVGGINASLNGRRVFTGGAAIFVSIAQTPDLGPTDVLAVSNLGATSGRLCGTYYDVPSAGLGLVRVQVTNALVTLIPLPPAGFRSTWITVVRGSSTVPTFGVRNTFFNEDTIAHSVTVMCNGLLTSRSSAPVASQVLGAVTGPVWTHAITGPLQWQLNEAVITTPVFAWGVYTTVPIG
jgi:hypothetical protein